MLFIRRLQLGVFAIARTQAYHIIHLSWERRRKLIDETILHGVSFNGMFFMWKYSESGLIYNPNVHLKLMAWQIEPAP